MPSRRVPGAHGWDSPKAVPLVERADLHGGGRLRVVSGSGRRRRALAKLTRLGVVFCSHRVQGFARLQVAYAHREPAALLRLLAQKAGLHLIGDIDQDVHGAPDPAFVVEERRGVG